MLIVFLLSSSEKTCAKGKIKSLVKSKSKVKITKTPSKTPSKSASISKLSKKRQTVVKTKEIERFATINFPLRDEAETFPFEDEAPEYVLPLKPYHKESSENFLKTAAKVLGWTDLSGNVVLDIGCGHGATSRAILDLFPKVQKVIAIDNSAECLIKAPEKNGHQQIEYEFGDITKIFSLSRWAEQVDKVVSVFCFNPYNCIPIAYKSLFLFMKPGGEAAILQWSKPGYVNFFKGIVESPKWEQYFKNMEPIIPPEFLQEGPSHSPAYWKKTLEGAGFEVVSCYEIDAHLWSFVDDEQCKNHISKVLSSRIPDEKKHQFREEAFQIFVKHNKRDKLGRLFITKPCLAIFLRKPISHALKFDSTVFHHLA